MLSRAVRSREHRPRTPLISAVAVCALLPWMLDSCSGPQGIAGGAPIAISGQEDREAWIAARLRIMRDPAGLPGMKALAASEVRNAGPDAMLALVGLLVDESAAPFAALSLGDMGTGAADAIPALTDCIKEGRAVESAAYALSRMGSLAHPPLLRLVRDRDATVRSNALSAFGNLVDQEADLGTVLVIVTLLHDGESEVRENAAWALWRLSSHPGAALPMLIQSIRDANEGVRTAAFMAIGEFGQRASAVVPDLLQVLEGDFDDDAREWAALTLAAVAIDLDSLAPRLLAQAERDEGGMRRQILGILARSPQGARLALRHSHLDMEMLAIMAAGGPVAVSDRIREQVLSKLADPRPDVRALAAQALKVEWVKQSAVASRLDALLGDSAAEVRASAAAALAGSRTVPADILSHLAIIAEADSQDAPRAAAIRALAPHVSTEGALFDVLSSALDDGVSDVVMAAIDGLSSVCDGARPGAYKALETFGATHTPSPEVVVRVWRALVRLQPRSGRWLEWLRARMAAAGPRTRSAMLHALSALDVPGTSEPLLAAWPRADGALRRAILASLVDHPDRADSIRELLLRVLQDSQESEQLIAITGLKQWSDDESVRRALRSALKRDNPESVRDAAARSLAIHGAESPP